MYTRTCLQIGGTHWTVLGVVRRVNTAKMVAVRAVTGVINVPYYLASGSQAGVADVQITICSCRIYASHGWHEVRQS